MSLTLDIMLMKSPTDSRGREPRPVRPALLAGLVVAPLLAASAAFWLPPHHGVEAAHVEAPSPVDLIGSLEGLPPVQR